MGSVEPVERASLLVAGLRNDMAEMAEFRSDSGPWSGRSGRGSRFALGEKALSRRPGEGWVRGCQAATDSPKAGIVEAILSPVKLATQPSGEMNRRMQVKFGSGPMSNQCSVPAGTDSRSSRVQTTR